MKNLRALKLVKNINSSLKTSTRFLSSTNSGEFIFHSPYKSISIPTENVTDFCLSKVDQWSDLPAMVCGATGKQLLFKDVKNLTKKFGSHLLNTGYVPGDKIAVIVPNCPEFGPVLLGSLGIAWTRVS